MTDDDPIFDAPPVPAFQLRDYQDDCLAAIEQGWKEFSRLLIVLATGTGKTVLFSRECQITVSQGGKVLILAHTDELLEQAIDKLSRSTGLVAAKEKASDTASPYASVVVASVQTLSRENRLRGFPDDHFSLVIVDEAHRCLAPSYQRVLNYFHFGKESLDEGWLAPVPGVPYEHKARVLGVTATADRGDKRTLGEFFQKCAYEYGLLEACRDGYLVRPIVRNIPAEHVKIDLRGIKMSKISGQADFDVSELGARITPFLRVIARHIYEEAKDRKTVCFLPSIETARLLAGALAENGLNASFVSGACPDREQKIADFHAAGRGSIIANAMLLTEGWDCPDASCIVVLRPTKIRALYTQCVGRGTRTLPGVIDGLATKEQRLLAIAASDKPDLLLLDFLWLTDRLDLVKPIDLVASSPELRKKMEERNEADIVACEAAASRDLLKALEEAAKKNARKKARTVDPLAWAVSLGDAALAGWEPESKWDELPPTEGQLELLRKHGIETRNITCRGLADKIVGRVVSRLRLGLCTPKQLSLMTQLGLDEQTCSMLTIKEATKKIDVTLRERKAARSVGATLD